MSESVCGLRRPRAPGAQIHPVWRPDLVGTCNSCQNIATTLIEGSECDRLWVLKKSVMGRNSSPYPCNPVFHSTSAKRRLP